MSLKQRKPLRNMWTTTTEGYCWLASAIGGSWLWQTPAEREQTIENLSLVYVSQARNRRLLPVSDREALDALVELSEVICQTLSPAANKRLVAKINKWRLDFEEQPF